LRHVGHVTRMASVNIRLSHDVAAVRAARWCLAGVLECHDVISSVSARHAAHGDGMLRVHLARHGCDTVAVREQAPVTTVHGPLHAAHDSSSSRFLSAALIRFRASVPDWTIDSD